MMNKKCVASFELVLMIVSVFAFSFIISGATPVVAQAATSQPSVCCEKTKDGAYCINTDSDNCAAGFKLAPSSCETTSYCRLGTCYESGEGICMANTPQRVCDETSGTWDSREIKEVPQCQLGCCIIAEQAAFVPLVRCKRLSTLFGVANDYRTDINSEIACIAEAQSQDVGACVYDKDFERLCEFTTRGDCGAGQEVETIGGDISDGTIEVSSGKKFYEDYLCSAEELNTACAKQTSTGCYQGKVYEFDSCGNRENVYSSDKDLSWNRGRVALPLEVCDGNDGSNKNCGNCEYLLGSRCAEWEGLLGIGKPSGSDYYCQSTKCVDRAGDERMNGESWCVNDGIIGEGSDTVGSRYYKEICVDGDVRVEPCADFRNEFCISGSIETSGGDFGTAGCVVNRWQNCWQIDDEDDCLNIDQRDCMWLPAVTGMVLGGGGDARSTGFSNPTSGGSAFTNPTADGSFTGNVVAPITGGAFFGGGDDDEEIEETTTNRPGGICVPNFPPGLEFWKEGNAKQMCSVANAKCVVTYEKGLIGSGWKCVENCECLEEGWAGDANRVCVGLGDCGGYVNFQGEYTDDGYKWTVDGTDKEFAPNTINKISGGFTGLVSAMTGLIAGGFGMITGKAAVVAKPSSFLQRVEARHLAGVDRAAFVAEVEAERAAALEAISGGAGLGVVTPAATLVPIEGTSFLSKTFLTPGMTAATSGGELAANALVGGFQWAAIAYLAGQMIGPMIGLSGQNADALSTAMAAGFGTYKTSAIYHAAATAQAAELAQAATALVTSTANAVEAAVATEAAASGSAAILTAQAELTLAKAAAAEAVTAAATPVAPAFNFLTANPALIGLAIGVVIFVVMYKKEKVEIVEFNCMPWQAPTGGDVCEECNDDDLPCSEYRCRALGQNCELENVGSDSETCVTVRHDDIDPPIIRPNDATLSDGHQYTNVKISPPGPGFTIINLESSDGCLKAFTPLEFGINTDEPAQCKIDFEQTTKFDDMRAFIGGSNLYAYNHSEQFALPGAADLVNASFILENGKDWQFYIRCKDKNGNENSAEYAVKFCVDPTPDSTAPEVKATSIINGGCVAEDQATAEVEFYTNEPADCRWSKEDQDYGSMQNTMACSSELYQMNALQLFTCKADLTGIPRDETTFYVRCKDQPGKDENERNVNQESYVFSLRGSTGLKLKKLQPNGTIFGAVRPAPVELYAETLFGCNDGQAVCYYSTVDNDNDYIRFFDTNNEDGINTQRLDLNEGQHKYYIKCVDEGGNVVKDSADFRLDIDENAPVVARVYEEDDLLKLVTVRDSECVYTFDDCDFSFAEGTVMPYANSTVHVAEWNEDKTYYIKCRDEFRNEDADCSVIVRPSRNLF